MSRFMTLSVSLVLKFKFFYKKRPVILADLDDVTIFLDETPEMRLDSAF